MWVEAVGACAASVGASSGAVMTGRLLRARTADGIAAGTAVLTAVMGPAWLAYGISIADVPQIAANSSWTMLGVVMSYLMLRPRGRRAAVLAGCVPLLALALLVGLGSWSADGPGWVGSFCAICVAVPQLVHSLRHGRGPGVSVLGWALGTVASCLWLTYGLATAAAPVIATTIAQIILGVAVLTVLCRARAPQCAPARAAGIMPS